MGGGAMLRAVGRVVGVGGGIAGPIQEACSACKTPRNVSTVRAASSSACSCEQQGVSVGNVVLPTSAAPSVTNSYWEVDDWEFAGDGRDKLGQRCFSDRSVFGSVPTKEEVEDATSDLQDALKRSVFPFSLGNDNKACETVDWMEPELHAGNREVVQQHGQSTVLDAFQLLQKSPTVQGMVISLAQDKAIWDAVLKNEKVQEFRESLQKGESKQQEETEGSHEAPAGESKQQEETEGSQEALAGKPNVFMLVVENTKVKVMEYMGKITQLINHIFGFSDPEKKIFAEKDGDILDRTLKSCLMLCVAVLLIVVFKRVPKI